MMSTTRTHLPAFQVVTYARDFLRAAQILEKHAIAGETDLFSVAAMNAGACFRAVSEVISG